MKIFLPAVLLFASSFLPLAAQNIIPNAGFETWINKGSYEDPENWGTLNAQTSIVGIKTVVKGTAAEAHSGSYAIKLITKFIGIPFNRKIPGLSATGTINTTTSAIDGGFAYNLRPVQISGWYKYAPAGKDTASVALTLSKWDVNTQKRVVVGTAVFMDTATVSTYTAFSAGINYVSSLAPDTAMIVLLSSPQNTGVLNSTFLADDLSLDMSSGIDPEESNSRIVIYPNPANTHVFISHAPASRFIVFDQKGSKVSECVLTNAGLADISSLGSGLYLYQLLDADRQVMKSGKLIINANK